MTTSKKTWSAPSVKKLGSIQGLTNVNKVRGSFDGVYFEGMPIGS